jgi:hypothetical protein
MGSYRWDPRLAPKPHPLDVRGRLRRRRQCDAEPVFMALVDAEPELLNTWEQVSYRLQTTYLNRMAAPWTKQSRHRRIAQTVRWLRDDWWDPRLAPEPHSLDFRGRLRRRRQCETVPCFMELLDAEPELRKNWELASSRLQNTYLEWMSAPWRKPNRRHRINQSLLWLRDDRLAEHVQHPTWLDAAMVVDAHLYQPPPSS